MSYVIPDEPRPGALGHLVVRPSAPLLASMLAGAWLAWPWFVLNAIALGSPTRRKEVGLVALAAAGTVALVVLTWLLIELGVIDSRTTASLAVLAISTWKLAMAYWVCIVQSRTFHVYEYYGGAVRSAGAVLAAGFWLRPVVLGLLDDPFLIIIVAGGL